LTSSACVYRRHCLVPTPESEGFVDDPEPSNLGYGWAKRFLEVQGRCYAQEYPIKIALPRPYNAYGPRDDFDWETSHVIPALIRKVVEGHNPIEVWGDGSQTRSFLYVSDFVEGLMLITERYPKCEPINIGSDEEVTIAKLIKQIIEIAGSQTEIEFNLSKPGGQPRRIGDYTKAHEILGFEPKVSLDEGLRRTITWYQENRTQ
jgi:GDP-L-fucose synthase